MSALIVPISVDGLWLDRAERVIGPPADYAILPWFDGKRDHYGSTANIAAAINAEPFADHQTWLKPGIHLHWALPRGLTRGSNRRTAVATIEIGELWMPPAPNRWLVYRAVAGGPDTGEPDTGEPDTGELATDRVWLVESDYVHPHGEGLGATVYPRSIRGPNDPPFVRLGRRIELDPETLAPLDTEKAPMRDETRLSNYGPALTALGPGDPHFAAHYPSCSSVFGLHDDDPPEGEGEVVYTVYGWYAADVTEPLANLMASLDPHPQPARLGLLLPVEGGEEDRRRVPPLTIDEELERQEREERGEEIIPGDDLIVPGGEPIVPLVGEPGELEVLPGPPGTAERLAALEERFGWKLELDPGGAVPTDILCHAQLRLMPSVARQRPAAEPSRPIGFGANPAEAFAGLAFAADDRARSPEVEDRVVQHLAGTDLANHPLDLEAKLREASHSEQFQAVSGHMLWTIRPRDDVRGETAPESLTLPDGLAHELNELNARQEAYDRAEDRIDGLRQALFADWTHYMRAAYPEGTTDQSSIDPDDIRALIERTRLSPLEALQRETGSLLHGEDAAGNTAVVDHLPEGAVAAGPIVGGGKGEPFEEALAAGDTIIGIDVRAGWIVDAVTLVTEEGGNAERHGGGGGRLHSVRLLPGERFTALIGGIGTYEDRFVIAGLEFETSFGRRLGPFGGSTRIGTTTPFRLDVPDGMKLSGLRGRADHVLTALGLLAAPAAEALPTSGPAVRSLARAVVEQHRQVQARLDAMGEAADLALGLTPGPRFWQPHDPVVALADPATRVGTRYAAGGANADEDGRNFCLAVELPRGWQNSGRRLAGNARAPRGVEQLPLHSDGHLRWATHQGKDTWQPLQLEWQVEVRPLSRSGNHATGRYATDFATSSHKLEPGEADLGAHADDAAHATTRTYQYLAGRSLLNPMVGQILRQRLDQLPSALGGHGVGLDHEVEPIVLPLGGFHDQLLMHRQEPQLEIADPIGLDVQQDLARRVRDALGDVHPTTPLPENPFQPIRSGEILIQRLRVIDGFGRTHEWTPQTIATVSRLRPKNGLRDRARLPIRLSQAARLDFRWLSAGHADIESNAHPATSPIIGWLLANEFDAAIAVYAASGRLLGEVDAAGSWQPAPGPRVRGPDDVLDQALRRVVRWLTEPRDGSFVPALLEAVDAASAMVDPQDAARHPARAMLMGRPLALARARLGLDLLHQPATDQSMATLRARLVGHDDDSHGFEQVAFPVRMGEHGQLDDGLCGYWIDAGERFEADRLNLPEGIEPTAQHPRLHRIEAADAASHPLRLSLATEPRTLTLLLDPRGRVHATAAILPTKAIAVPPDQFTPALESLRTTFRVSPVLTPPDAVELPLPAEPGYAWSWIERRGADWHETPHHPTVRREAVIAGFGASGAALWQVLVESGRLVVDDDEGRGLLLPGDLAALDAGLARSGLAAQGLDREAVARGLHQIAEAIDEAGTAARYTARAVARAGWLQLRPLPRGAGGAASAGKGEP